VAFEQRGETFVDAACDAEALVDEAGVELNQPGPGADFLPGVFGCEDAAAADNLRHPARELSQGGDDLRRATAKRRAAQAAVDQSRDLLARSPKAVAARRRVGCDEAGDFGAARCVNDQLKLARAEVWRDLDEQRHGRALGLRGKLAIASLKLAEERGEEVIEKATTGEDEAEEMLDQVVPEEQGGPFVESNAGQEFAYDTDLSNPKGAKREPFPTT